MLSEARPRKGDHRERPLPLLFTRMRCALLKNICSALICAVGRALLKNICSGLVCTMGCALQRKYLHCPICALGYALQKKYLQRTRLLCGLWAAEKNICSGLFCKL